jgi:hypothetical protein
MSGFERDGPASDSSADDWPMVSDAVEGKDASAWDVQMIDDA